MPTKARIKRDHAKRDDPHDELVPIDGARVRAVLEWRGLSRHNAAKRIRERLRERLRENDPAPKFSSQLLDRMASGEQRKCRASVRWALTKVIGPPVTAKYLAGEAEIAPVGLMFPPSALPGALPLSIDMVGAPLRPLSANYPLPPRFELEALKLGHDLERAQSKEGRPLPHLAPNLPNAARWALSLAFWREFLFDRQQHGASGEKMQEQSANFAYHLGEALRILSEPWFAGRVTVRRNLLHFLVFGLDRVATINEAMHHERQKGRLTELALRDYANGFPGADSGQVRDRMIGMRLHRDHELLRGRSEEAIASDILAGTPDDGGVP